MEAVNEPMVTTLVPTSHWQGMQANPPSPAMTGVNRRLDSPSARAGQPTLGCVSPQIGAKPTCTSPQAQEALGCASPHPSAMTPGSQMGGMSPCLKVPDSPNFDLVSVTMDGVVCAGVQGTASNP